MNRKGAITTLQLGIWILRIMMLAFVVLLVTFLIESYVATKVDVSPVEAEVVFQRILFSPALLAKDSITGTVRYGVLDLAALAGNAADVTKALEQDIQFGIAAPIGVKLSVRGTETADRHTVFINQRKFEDLAPQAGAFLKGFTIFKTTRVMPVTLAGKTAEYPGMLTVEIVKER